LEGEVKDEVLLVGSFARGAEVKGNPVKREGCCLDRDGWMDWRLQQVAALHFAWERKELNQWLASSGRKKDKRKGSSTVKGTGAC
jgi:hypothetical protein